ncbi:hypothetical protein LUCX_171 [Xanthomonas phage vB_XciM_LucasX]|nr:hypothetical protein LUCX_171 [Xanthomonas phage vB_XciM_LucasX]
MMTEIRSEGLLKGNVDITDEAQAQLSAVLAEKEMLALFPEFFAFQSTAVVVPSLSS